MHSFLPFKRRILPLLLFLILAAFFAPAASFAGISISVTIAPPELPVYSQPLCPGDGYIWVPGYWAWYADYADYYWVPGTWVEAPEEGFLWTPGYWAWGGSGYVFYDGYWGPEVGFYGGIDYGYGYTGHGYQGGRWDHGHFFYNRSVNNVNVTVIHNVYNTTVVNRPVTRVSYNGGRGGVNDRPTAGEESAAHARHMPRVAAQNQQIQAARANTQLRATVNHGRPPVAATSRPGSFSGGGTVAAREGSYNPPANRPGSSPNRAAEGARGNSSNRPMNASPTNAPNTEMNRQPDRSSNDVRNNSRNNAPNGSVNRPENSQRPSTENSSRRSPAIAPATPTERPAAPNSPSPPADQNRQQQSERQNQQRQAQQQRQDRQPQQMSRQPAGEGGQRPEQPRPAAPAAPQQRQQEQRRSPSPPSHQAEPRPADNGHRDDKH